jgi:hypothetical protein
MDNIWDIYTAKSEYDPYYLDQYGRVPSLNAPFDVMEPVVSKYLYQQGFKPSYPNNKEFAVCISHDVDWVFNQVHSFKHFAKNSFIQSLKLNFKEIKKYSKELKKYIPENYNLNTTLSFNKKYDFRSSFYFLALNENDEDYRYDIFDIKDQFNAVFNNECEIGLHGGHTAYFDSDKLKIEKNKLEEASTKQIVGYRNHYLKFDIRKTWKNLEKNNFSYDTTYGFANMVGFRNGMCHPFIPFDLPNNCFHTIKEIPLIAMDMTLFKYLFYLNNENSIKLISKLVRTIKKYGGVFTLLWHNNNMLGEKGALYEQIICLLKEENGWFASGNELIDWYEKSNYFMEMDAILKKVKK